MSEVSCLYCQLVCVVGAEINMTVMPEDMTIWMDRSIAQPAWARLSRHSLMPIWFNVRRWMVDPAWPGSESGPKWLEEWAMSEVSTEGERNRNGIDVGSLCLYHWTLTTIWNKEEMSSLISSSESHWKLLLNFIWLNVSYLPVVWEYFKSLFDSIKTS